MPFYRPRRIYAEQWTGHHPDVQPLKTDTPNKICSICKTTLDRHGECGQDTSTLSVCPGAWLVRYFPDGPLGTYHEQYFREQYELIDDETRATQPPPAIPAHRKLGQALGRAMRPPLERVLRGLERLMHALPGEEV